MDNPPIPVLLLVGATGTGKSDASYHVFSRLWRGGTPTARLDLDDVGMCHPAPADDVDNMVVKADAMAAAWGVFARHGARCFVVSSAIDTAADLETHRRMLPDAKWTVVRLRIAAEERRRRYIRRGQLLGYSEEQMLATSDTGGDEEARLDGEAFFDLVVNTDAMTSEQVADAILERTGWPDLT